MSEDVTEKDKPISRRDFLKVGALAATSIAAKSASEKLNLEPKTEVLKVGNLDVHLLPFDHIEGAAGVPKAREAYEKIKADAPNAIPFIEYFIPEIDRETGSKPPEPGTDVSRGSQITNIRESYGALLDEVKADRVLVADPAYNYNFVIPEFLPPVVDVATMIGGINLVKKAMEKGDIADKKVPIKKAAYVGAGLGLIGVGATSSLKNVEEIGSGTTSQISTNTKEPLNFPSIIGEADFRMITVAQAIEQIGNTTEELGTKDIILIYPPAHIDRIRQLLTESPASWVQRNIKSELYRKLYSALDITNIREWTRNGNDWQKIKQTPIDFDFLKPPSI
jgi:hypothetical protein